VDGAALHMGTDFSPFDGKQLRGWPEVVVSGGRVVLDADGFHDPGAVGRLVARAAQEEARGGLVASAPLAGKAV